MKFWKSTALAIVLFVNPAISLCQEPIYLFSDSVKLTDGYLRLATWNLKHINLQPGARDLLPGSTDEEDFTSLVKTFAKAIDDLDLDLVVAVEVQPRQSDPNRLEVILHSLNQFHGSSANATPSWSTRPNIPYDNPNDPFGNLQFGLLWDSTKVEVAPNDARLLEDLRQPRDQNINLENRSLRIPWLVPIRSNQLECDLLILHLKSGGEFLQAAEVAAPSGFIRQRLTGTHPRHLIMLGDWNIRPDTSQGRGRLRQLQVATNTGNRMMILTVVEIKPTLEDWESLGTFNATEPVSDFVPFTHFNVSTIDTMLDHVAISRTMSEIFDNPIQVELAGGGSDPRCGIEVAHPMIREEDYVRITDHVPVILTLRTTGITEPEPPPTGISVRIVAAIPNPHGVDSQLEQVSLRNFGTHTVSLVGWRIGDSTHSQFWQLNSAQYNDSTSVDPGQTVIIIRQGRNMSLNNNGDTIRLLNNQQQLVDFRTYGNAASG
jgi:hypothetical protein